MYYEWTDPVTGIIYEINYIVTQFESEGPEHLVWREKRLTCELEWNKLPPFALDPDHPEIAKAVSDHFHGPVIEHIDPFGHFDFGMTVTEACDLLIAFSFVKKDCLDDVQARRIRTFEDRVRAFIREHA